MFTLFILALALSLDGFLASAALRLCYPSLSLVTPTRAAVCFTFFQGVMFLLGWLLGVALGHIVEKYDQWVSFLLLLFIGLRMLKDAIRIKDPSNILNKSKESFLCEKKFEINDKNSSSLMQRVFAWLEDKKIYLRIKDVAKYLTGKETFLYVISFATSIDAFMVGVSLKSIEQGIIVPLLIICFVTFIVTLLGTCLGSVAIKNILIAKYSMFCGALLVIGIALHSFFTT